MREAEEEILQEVLNTVRPYLAFPSDLEKKIGEISEESSDLDEFEDGLRDLEKDEDDSSRRADYRIFLNKLQSR